MGGQRSGPAVFFGLYGWAQRARGPALACGIGGIFGLGVALLPINPGALCLFMYAVAFLDRVRRPAVAGVSLAVLLWWPRQRFCGSGPPPCSACWSSCCWWA